MSTLDGSDGQRHTGRLGNVAIEPSLIGHAIIELHYRCGGDATQDRLHSDSP